MTMPEELCVPGEAADESASEQVPATALPADTPVTAVAAKAKPRGGDPLDDPTHPLYDTLTPPAPDLITSLQDQREWFARMCFALLGEATTWRRVKRAILYGTPKEMIEALKLVSTSALQASAPKDAQAAPVNVQIINHVPRPEGAPPIRLAPAEQAALP